MFALAPEAEHTILVGEGEPEVRSYLGTALKCLGYGVEVAGDGQGVICALQSAKSRISAVLLDLMMPPSGGLKTLEALRQTAPDLPVIMLSSTPSTVDIVTAMKGGASDFFCKPMVCKDLEDLKVAITRAIADQVARSRKFLLQHRKTGFIGSSPLIEEILSLVPVVGRSEAPVLIQGETGTGKEVLARELHANSPRVNGPFLKINCTALPSELFESELFGYERGAFTGASQKKLGLFEMANGGTILLDEIGDMDLRLQAKLLHVLQDQEYQRVGGNELVRVNVRVIATTHQDVELAISERRFREDLYYRLSVINLWLPPLRERRDDIMPLAQHLVSKHSPSNAPALKIGFDMRPALLAYPWPGNVRELENVMRRYIVFRNPALITNELQNRTARKGLAAAATHRRRPLPTETPDISRSDTSSLTQLMKAKQDAEAEVILTALNSTRWNRKQAAVLLKIDYKALLYRMKKLGLEENVVPFALATQTTFKS